MFKYEESFTNENGEITVYIQPQTIGNLFLTFQENEVDFLEIELKTEGMLNSGSLFTVDENPAIYYYASNGKRYVFPHEKIYMSWFDNFADIIVIDQSITAQIPFGGVVKYKPGYRMVKIQTDPKVYAVDKNGVLRWIKTEKTAISLYGSDWNKKIDDISDAFFINYQVGEPIVLVSDYDPSQASIIEDNFYPAM